MELWDVLDEYGNKTGKTIKRGSSLSQGEYRLVVDVWIMNGNNEFLISKRTPQKHPDPDKWEPTLGSATIEDDDSISAALREVREELGVMLNSQAGILIKRFKSRNVIFDVWLFRQEVDVSTVVLQEEEVDEFMWATESKIKELIKKGEFIPKERIPYMDKLFKICRV